MHRTHQISKGSPSLAVHGLFLCIFQIDMHLYEVSSRQRLLDQINFVDGSGQMTLGESEDMAKPADVRQ